MRDDDHVPESYHPDSLGHVYEIAVEKGEAVGVTHFRYPDEPAAEPDVPLATVCSALSEIVNWSCDGQDPSMCAARIFSIQTMLNPVNARYRSLAQIASACNISRASISKSLLIFRDAHSIQLSVGRLQSSREIFRQATLASVAAGTHYSCHKKNDNLETVNSGNHEMNPKEIRETYNTLDKAVTRLEELESQLEATSQTIETCNSSANCCVHYRTAATSCA